MSESLRDAEQEFETPLTPAAALDRVVRLLRAESVQLDVTGTGARSTKVPLALLSWDRAKYSRRNWVGVNPFVWFDSVEVTCAETVGGSRVAIRLDRLRLILFCVYWWLLTGLIATAAPIGATLCLVVVGVVGNAVAWRLAKSLVRTEVSAALK